MKKNKKREKRMYYISEIEYIYFPLIVRSKTYLYSTINTNKNQLVKCILCSK
jgi:hypothetical protein